MIENINKMKKKRKVSDTSAEAPVKKKKTKNHENNETRSSVNIEVSKTPAISEEKVQKNNKRKEKKKKRESAEIAEISIVDESPKINGNAESTGEKIENGVPTNFIVKSGEPEVSGDISQAQGNSTKREKRKKRKLNGNAIADNKTTQNEGTNDKDADNDSENEDRQEIKVSNKEANRLTGKSLRKSFNSQGGIAALSKFLAVCKENTEKDLAADYLQAGGSLLEILRLLDTSDKKNLNNANTVFAAMHLIIMKILADYPQYTSRAEEACRHFINSHLSIVHSMLSSQSNAKNRKTVLRLLASMVSLGGSLPRELLAHLSFHSQVLDTLSEHTKPTDAQSVRTCFIHFVLSFLVEGTTPVIRAMLDKRGMLSCIFPELVYDSYATVHLVLETVKTSVLENPAISKTSKLHVFSTPVLQSLVSLYNWKGPKNWPGIKGKKREATKDIVHPEEKEIAVEAVHNFLITLLTSYRQGVIFHDRTLGTSGVKNNQLVNTILQSLDRPWEHPKPMDLIIKVLVACPDLIRSQLIYTEPFLEPRASKKWILVMRFVGKLIESLEANSCLKPCLPELSASQLISAALTLTIPIVVLKSAILPSLQNSHTIIRHEAVILLATMLRQTKAFISVVQNNSNDTADYIAFRHAINDYITKNVPNLETTLKVWSLGLGKPISDEETDPEDIGELIPRRHDHFAAILDLLDAYRDLCPERLDLEASKNEDLQPSILLSGLNELPDLEIEEHVDMKVRALQFLLVIDPAAFAPTKPLFGDTLVYLIALLNKNATEIDGHSRKTIKTLMIGAGLFEGCLQQVDIWINSFTHWDDSVERFEIANWFVKITQQAIKRTDKYLDVISEAEEIAGEQIYSAERLEEIFNDLYERETGDSESRVSKMLPWTSISPLLCSALENAKKNPNENIAKYLSYVTILTLHCQVAPGTLIHLTKDVENLTARKYLNSWRDNDTPLTIKKPFESSNIVSKLSKILLSDETLELEKIFDGERLVEFENREKKYNFSHDLSEYEIGVLLRMTLFHATQFMQKATLTQELFDKHEVCIVALLNAAKNLRDSEDFALVEEFSKAIFMHPAILQYFSPFCKSKNIIETIVTTGLLNICRVIVDLNEKSKLAELFQPLKNKLISQLRLATKKCKNGGKVKNTLSLMEYIEILRPDGKDIIDILRTIMELPKESFLAEDKVNLSIWGAIVPKLIELLSRKGDYSSRQSNPTIDATFVKKIVAYVTQLKTNRKVILDSWEESLQKYLENYPHNIAGIDGRSFNSLIAAARSSASINLVAFLVGRNNQYAPLFTQYLAKNPKIIRQSDLLFPIISSNLSYPWSKEFLKMIFTNYKNDVMRYFAEPSSDKNWVSRNVEATIYLIDSCFDAETCGKACDTVLSSGDKLDSVDTNYAKLVESLFKRSAALGKDSVDPLTKLIQVLIRVTVSALKKDAKNEEKLRALCRSLCDTIAFLRAKNSAFVFEELNKNYSWPQFTRFSLKNGLKSSKDEKKDVPLLRTLVSVCDIAYAEESENEYVKTLFEMTTSHSEFVNLMLSSQSAKKDLLELLWILIRKNHSTMSSSQIPLYLAAYNATLSESDQLILLILRHYESNGIKFNEYRPYLWGEAAATYYSVKGEADTALWRQPSTSQVIDLFNSEIIIETIKNFPVHRDLKPTELCAKKNVYDPSFFLPLLTYLLSENNVVACHKVTQSGALALVFAACGSACEETRLAAYVVIKRFYFHMEATSSKEKLLWMRLIDALRNGVINMDTPLKGVRLSCLVSTFLARASLITTRPMNRLYSSIQTFFMAKPAMELNTIPELLNFFHNSEIEHLAHRHWILEVIRDGMKTDFDMELALRCVIFKMLQGFYSSVLSDPITKRLVLQVIEATVKIPKAALRLSLSYGLLPWITEIASNLDHRDIESVNLLVSIVRELLNVVLNTNDHNSHLQLLLLVVLKNLQPRLTKNIPISCFSDYTSSLADILPTKTSFREAISRREIEEIVEIGKKILGDVDDSVDCLQHGTEYVKKTNDCGTGNDEITIAKSNLRKLVLTWCPTAR